jgi:hypothetical protein
MLQNEVGLESPARRRLFCQDNASALHVGARIFRRRQPATPGQTQVSPSTDRKPPQLVRHDLFDGSSAASIIGATAATGRQNAPSQQSTGSRELLADQITFTSAPVRSRDPALCAFENDAQNARGCGLRKIQEQPRVLHRPHNCLPRTLLPPSPADRRQFFLFNHSRFQNPKQFEEY